MFVIKQNKLVKMQTKRSKSDLPLLPAYFKKVGLAVTILAIVPSMVAKMMSVDLAHSHKDLFRLVISNAFILGLTFIAWSEDRNEDEMTVAIRFKAMAMAMGWVITYEIFKPFIYLLMKFPEEQSTGQSVVLSLLFFYLMIYYLQKLGR